MNPCRYTETLSAFFDRELPPEKARAVRDHVNGCAECRHELEAIAGLSRRFDEEPPPLMSPEAARRIAAALAAAAPALRTPATTGATTQTPVEEPVMIAAAPAPAWFVARNGDRYGPYSPEDIARFAAEGNVLPETLLWTDGMTDWVRADRCDQFSALFGAPTPTPMARAARRSRLLRIAAVILLALIPVAAGTFGGYRFLKQRRERALAKAPTETPDTTPVVNPTPTPPKPTTPRQPAPPVTPAPTPTPDPETTPKKPVEGFDWPEEPMPETGPAPEPTPTSPTPPERPKTPKRPHAAFVAVPVQVAFGGEEVAFATFWPDYQDAIGEIEAREAEVDKAEQNVKSVAAAADKDRAALEEIEKETRAQLAELADRRKDALAKIADTGEKAQEVLRKAYEARREAEKQAASATTRCPVTGKLISGGATVSPQFTENIRRAQKQLEEVKKTYERAKVVEPGSGRRWSLLADAIKRDATEKAKPHLAAVRRVGTDVKEAKELVKAAETAVDAAKDKLDRMNDALEPHRPALLKAGYLRVACRYHLQDEKPCVSGGRWEIIGAEAPALREKLVEEAGKARQLADNYWKAGRKDLALPFYQLVADKFPGTPAARAAAEVLNQN
jgi:tetratricopeptide (TPR) repeat protein